MTRARDRLPPPGLLTTQDLTTMGIPLDLVRSWVRRRRLARAGGTDRHPWYRAEDIAPLAAAWQTRRRTSPPTP